jgi:hypothetical protein
MVKNEFPLGHHLTFMPRPPLEADVMIVPSFKQALTVCGLAGGAVETNRYTRPTIGVLLSIKSVRLYFDSFPDVTLNCPGNNCCLPKEGIKSILELAEIYKEKIVIRPSDVKMLQEKSFALSGCRH